jgi:hypothetical protein
MVFTYLIYINAHNKEEGEKEKSSRGRMEGTSTHHALSPTLLLMIRNRIGR